MKTLLTHGTCLAISTLIAAPLFMLNGVHQSVAQGRVPWMAGSLFMAGLWAIFLACLIFAPVSSVVHYLIENRFRVHWLFEPLILAGVLAVYAVLVSLVFFAGMPTARLLIAAAVSLYFPTLIYYLVLRAVNLREYL